MATVVRSADPVYPLLGPLDDDISIDSIPVVNDIVASVASRRLRSVDG